MSRRPEPDELQARKGNPAKRSLNREDKPTTEYLDKASGVPAPPAMIAPLKRASELWNEIVPILQTMGVLGKADVTIVARYCVTLSALEVAAQDLERVGYEMEYKTGAKQISPALTAYTKLSDQALKIEKELGLTPAARTKVSTWGGNRPPARPTDDAEPDAPHESAPAHDDETPETFKLTGTD